MDLRLGPSLKFEILSQGAEKATSCVGPPLKPGWGLQVCAPLLGVAGGVHAGTRACLKPVCSCPWERLSFFELWFLHL